MNYDDRDAGDIIGDDAERVREEILVHPLNFALVDNGIFRSGFPDFANFGFLKSLRLRSLISLCPEPYPQPNLEFLNANGIKLYQFGMESCKVVEISMIDNEPSSGMDIMYAEGTTLSKSLTSMEHLFPRSIRENPLEPLCQLDPSLRYKVIQVHPRSPGKNCKWSEMFKDIDIVLFCVALSDYDEYTVDSNGVSTNKMLADKHLFESVITHPTFSNKKFLLILNQFDLLEEKIELVPLTRCEWFSDFNPVISHNHSRGSKNNYNASLAHRAFHYIAVKFKRLFLSITGRKLFVWLVTGLESDTVDEALRYAREIMMWDKRDPSFATDHEQTSTMEEPSTF